MKRVFVKGWGAVSPAGWGVAPLREALARGEPVPTKTIPRPGRAEPFIARGVPAPPARPAFLGHARLRRTSPIAQYAAAAATEALGPDRERFQNGSAKLGIVLCVMSGCVNYTRRFYDETLRDPATASPLVFPETVFNAPASHLAALLGATGATYTLVGDAGTFLQGMALAADWLGHGRVDGCLVIGAEELDWLVLEAYWLFTRNGTAAEGAGALYLSTESNGRPGIELVGITDSYLFSKRLSRADAAQQARAELNGKVGSHLLCDGLQGVPRLDRDEAAAWSDFQGARLSPKRLCGEAFTAAAAWQCVVAVDTLALAAENASADVSIVGSNEQAIAARFARIG